MYQAVVGIEVPLRYVAKVEETPEAIVAEIQEVRNHLPRCGECGRQTGRTKGRMARRQWRDLKIRDRPLILAYAPRRVVCPECGVRVERVPWAGRYSRVTKGLVRAVAELSRKTDLSTVAGHYGINWKTVASILHRVVEWGLARRRKKPLHVIGLDEVSRKKGHRYLTLVYDLERGELVWVGRDRTNQTVEAFFDELGERRCKTLQAVSMDMWRPYIDTVKARAPQATIVFDRFHVVRHLN